MARWAVGPSVEKLSRTAAVYMSGHGTSTLTWGTLAGLSPTLENQVPRAQITSILCELGLNIMHVSGITASSAAKGGEIQKEL